MMLILFLRAMQVELLFMLMVIMFLMFLVVMARVMLLQKYLLLVALLI